jgi:hypothetical protein
MLAVIRVTGLIFTAIIAIGIRGIIRQRALRLKRLEDFRNSPESHLIRLND